MAMIYMDNAATSYPKPPEVIEATLGALRAPASPGRSGHAASLAATRWVHRARKNMARLLGVPDNSRLVFFANITWALNTVLEGFGLKTGDHVISSSAEHNSVARPLTRLAAEKGLVWETVPSDSRGLSEPGDFKKRLRPNTRLIVLNHASNVTGALTSPAEIKKAVDGLPILLDAAQTAGALDLRETPRWADFLAFTGHKGLLGPTGTGGLWIGEGFSLRPLAIGGTGSASDSLSPPGFLPDAFEAGTANTHGLAGLAAATDYLLQKGVDTIRRHELDLTMNFLNGLSQIRGVKVFGPLAKEKRVATISISVEGWSSSDFSKALETRFGILTRAGLQCAPLAHAALGSLKKGGLTRFSFGPFNTQNEIEAALSGIDRLAALKR